MDDGIWSILANFRAQISTSVLLKTFREIEMILFEQNEHICVHRYPEWTLKEKWNMNDGIWS